MGRRPATAAAFAVVLLVVGQVAALAHEASTRHVVCSEHGEQLEAVTLAGSEDLDHQAHWRGVEGDRGGEHEDCAIARTLRENSVAPQASHLTSTLLLISAEAISSPTVVVLAFACYRIAPKTSPPVVG